MFWHAPILRVVDNGQSQPAHYRWRRDSDAVTVGSPLPQGFLMTALRYPLDDASCQQCKLQLFHGPETINPPIVFCEVCLSGGPYVEGQPLKLTANFITRSQRDRMMREILPLRY
jgi:hypothetical protein